MAVIDLSEGTVVDPATACAVVATLLVLTLARSEPGCGAAAKAEMVLLLRMVDVFAEGWKSIPRPDFVEKADIFRVMLPGEWAAEDLGHSKLGPWRLTKARGCLCEGNPAADS
jgi:hypothetical protein